MISSQCVKNKRRHYHHVGMKNMIDERTTCNLSNPLIRSGKLLFFLKCLEYWLFLVQLLLIALFQQLDNTDHLLRVSWHIKPLRKQAAWFFASRLICVGALHTIPKTCNKKYFLCFWFLRFLYSCDFKAKLTLSHCFRSRVTYPIPLMELIIRL